MTFWILFGSYEVLVSSLGHYQIGFDLISLKTFKKP